MKLLSFITTLLIQFLSVVYLKLLDNFSLIILIFITCITSGLVIQMNDSAKSKINNIGWGLLFGSLTSLTLTVIFVIWLALSFPK
jgi:hypothetical protein